MPESKVRSAPASHLLMNSVRDGHRKPNTLTLVACRLFAFGLLALLAALLVYYPPGPVVVAIALAAYALVIWRQPALWLFVVPALLPVLDFSAWTGWFYVREIDFLVLATLIVGYWKVVPERSAHPVSPLAKLLLFAIAGSYAISTYLALGGLPPIDADSFATYQSPYVGIRTLLGFVWAILLLPLLTRSLATDETNLTRYLYPGITLGLGLAALVTLWERLTFSEIIDFASDYRTTGSFPEMHTGGAALDGYLVLTLPFCAIWALRSKKLSAMGMAGAAFALGTYATLVTFTRSTNVAFVAVVGVVLVGFLISLRSQVAPRQARPIAGLIVFLLLAVVLARVFSTGGYRTLAAALGMVVAGMFVGATGMRDRSKLAVGFAVLLGSGAMAGLMAIWTRSIYLSYAAVALLFALGVGLFWLDRDRQRGVAMMWGCFPLLALGTVLIAWYWSDGVAHTDALIAIVAVVGIVILNKSVARPIWTLNRESIVVAAIVALGLVMIIPVTGGHRMKERFAGIGADMDLRIAHWREGLALIEPGWVAGAFGMGLGTYPKNYLWNNSKGEFPGVHTYPSEGGNTFLRVGGPRTKIGYGESLRVFQLVSMQPGGNYRLSFDARSNVPARMGFEVCRKWLIYRVRCAQWEGSGGTSVGSTTWTRFNYAVSTVRFGPTPWYSRPTIHLAIGVETAGAYVEIDNVSLIDEAGRNLVRNGDFEAANAWWYFSSDHHHLPYHAKNLQLHLLFEQGWVGLVLVSLLIFYAICRFARGMMNRDLLAVAPLAGLIGFLMVGVFDSLLDTARLALMFYLVLFLALKPDLMRRQPAQHPMARRQP